MSIPPRIVLASTDLNTRARVLEAAGERPVELVGATGFGSHLQGAGLLILDLDQGGTGALAELVAAREAGTAPERVIGFFSHVDRELGRAARTAGCRAVARGRFWAHLREELGG